MQAPDLQHSSTIGEGRRLWTESDQRIMDRHMQETPDLGRRNGTFQTLWEELKDNGTSGTETQLQTWVNNTKARMRKEAARALQSPELQTPAPFSPPATLETVPVVPEVVAQVSSERVTWSRQTSRWNMAMIEAKSVKETEGRSGSTVSIAKELFDAADPDQVREWEDQAKKRQKVRDGLVVEPSEKERQLMEAEGWKTLKRGLQLLNKAGSSCSGVVVHANNDVAVLQIGPKGQMLQEALVAKGVRLQDLAMATVWGVGPSSGKGLPVKDRRKIANRQLLDRYNDFLRSKSRPQCRQLPITDLEAKCPVVPSNWPSTVGTFDVGRMRAVHLDAVEAAIAQGLFFKDCPGCVTCVASTEQELNPSGEVEVLEHTVEQA